jgi:hypothetical protein
MPYAQSHFQPIAELPSEHGLTLWGYATRQDPAATRAPGYFQPYAHHLKLGDLLLVRHTGARAGPDPAGRPAPSLRLCGVDRDSRGVVVLHEIWAFAWADARAGAAPGPAARGPAGPPAPAPADRSVRPAGKRRPGGAAAEA